MDHNQTRSDMVLKDKFLGPESISQPTREEQRRISKSSDNYGEGRTKPSGCQSADVAPCERNRRRLTKIHNIGT